MNAQLQSSFVPLSRGAVADAWSAYIASLPGPEPQLRAEFIPAQGGCFIVLQPSASEANSTIWAKLRGDHGRLLRRFERSLQPGESLPTRHWQQLRWRRH